MALAGRQTRPRSQGLCEERHGEAQSRPASDPAFPPRPLQPAVPWRSPAPGSLSAGVFRLLSLGLSCPHSLRPRLRLCSLEARRESCSLPLVPPAVVKATKHLPSPLCHIPAPLWACGQGGGLTKAGDSCHQVTQSAWACSHSIRG